MTDFDDDPELIGTQAAIRAAVVGCDDERAEELARTLQGPDESVEQAVVGALDKLRYEHGTRQRFIGGLIRWLRRAARDDQTWALGRIGVHWWPQLSLDSYDGDTQDRTDEREIDADEAERCREIAAARGHRGAAFWHGTLDSLLTAYGDGQPDEFLTADNLRAAQLRIARRYADLNDPEADEWFRRAVDAPRWEDEDILSASWVEAVSEYGLWAHSHGDRALCEQLSARVIDNVILEGQRDRSIMDSDAHKPYRDSYQLAAGNEAARWKTMVHLLADHDLTPEAQLELLRVLSTNHYLRQWDNGLSGRIWRARHGAFGDERAVEAALWDLTGWLLADAVPRLLRIVGCDVVADRIVSAVSTIDFSVDAAWAPDLGTRRRNELRQKLRSVGAPLDEIETAKYDAMTAFRTPPLAEFLTDVFDPEASSQWIEWRNRAEITRAESRIPWMPWTPWARGGGCLRDVGLGPAVSSYEIGLQGRSFTSDTPLIRGSDAWLAGYLADIRPEPDGWRRVLSWVSIWDGLSPMVTEYFDAAAGYVGARRYGPNSDPLMTAAFDEWEADVRAGVSRRVSAIVAAATAGGS